MPRDLLQSSTLLTAVAVFGLVAALWLIGVMVWSMRRSAREERIRQRLAPGTVDELSAGTARTLSLWREGGEATTVVSGGAAKPSLAVRLERRRRDAGLTAELGALLAGLTVASGGAGAVMLVLTGSPIPAGAAAVAVVLGFHIYVQGRVVKRAALFEKQFVDALELAARSLRAGHPLLGALQLISEELDPPVSTVFADICQQHDLGVSLEDAIQRTTSASSSSELKLFATSVAVQLRSGGNLADMMDRLAEVIHERARLSRRVRVLTAQTQFSKRILVALPFIIFALLSTINPGYMSMFYETPTGNVLLGAAAASLMLGVLMMNRMAVIKY